MNLKTFTIHDTCAGAYHSPFYQPNVDVAIRAFAGMLSDENSVAYKNPEHFKLYYLGEFDDVTGYMEPVDPELVISGLELKERL